MPTATERLHSIAEILQSQPINSALVQSINAYLAGLGSMDEVRAAWEADPGRLLASAPIYMAWNEVHKLLAIAQGSDPLDEFEMRYVAVSVVLFSYTYMLYGLGTTARMQQALEFLRQSVSDPRILLMCAVDTAYYAFRSPRSPLGQCLLSFVPEVIDALAALESAWKWPHHWNYAGLVILLLAAEPPDLEHAWLLVRLADQHGYASRPFMEECLRLLLQADPERATEWARSLVQTHEDAWIRTTALNLLMQRDPARHIDLAAEVARSPVPSNDWNEVRLREDALKATYSFDPVAHFPLIEAAALGQHASLAYRALQILSENRNEQAHQLLQRCVTDGVLLASQRALNMLTGQPWEGQQAFILSLLAHRFSDIRQKAWAWLARQGDASLEPLTALLADRRAAIRHAAAQALGQIGTERAIALLASRLEHETSARVRQTIAVILDDLRSADHRSLSREAVLEHAEWLHRYAPQPALPWFNLEDAPALRWTNGTPVPPVVLGYLLHRQSRQKQSATLNDYARRVLALIDRNTSGDLALALFNGWLTNGAHLKDAWLIPLACALGDDRLVPLLQHTVENWQKGKEFTLSLNILQAMPLSEAPTLPGALKDLAKRLRRLKLKRAAKDALAAVQP
ncbi:MAG TPA: HEAT repeat domain-containing protein [Ktedonobacterales bacterium]|jgi:hypothetical protein